MPGILVKTLDIKNMNRHYFSYTITAIDGSCFVHGIYFQCKRFKKCFHDFITITSTMQLYCS